MADYSLSEKQKQSLLSVARKVIEATVKKESVSKYDSDDPVFNESRGCFVTIHNNGQLRGCIGNFMPRGSLLTTVVEMAQAACKDSRFVMNPITIPELTNIDVEISVLSPLEKTDDPMSLELGVHGIYITKGYHGGCFLPQVATETGWSKEEFLGQCCSQKAGLSWEAWKEPDTEVLLFTADVFGEKENK